MAFQAANAAKRILETTTNPAASLAASKILADIAYKGYAMGWGTTAKVDLTVKSQEDLPRWADLPDDVKAALDQWLASAGGRDDGA